MSLSFLNIHHLDKYIVVQILCDQNVVHFQFAIGYFTRLTLRSSLILTVFPPQF